MRSVRGFTATVIGVLVGIVAAAPASPIPPAPADVLLTDVGFGFTATGDEPDVLGEITRHFEGPGATLDLAAIPVEPPVRAAQLFELIAGADLGLARIEEPDLGLATWLVEEGTRLGDSPVVFLFFATEEFIFSALLATDGSTSLDPVEAAREIARRQLERAGGALAPESAGDRATPEGRAAELSEFLPGDLGPLTVAGTVDAGEELPEGITPDDEVLQFLDDRSTGIVRIWGTQTLDLSAAVSLTEYPFEVFAAAALGTVPESSDTDLVANPRMDVADAVTFVGTGSRSDQVGAAFRRGRLFVLVLTTRSSDVSIEDAEAVVAAIATETAARLPDQASSPYELPGSQPTFVALAVSSGLVTSATLGATGVGRVRSRRVRRRTERPGRSSSRSSSGSSSEASGPAVPGPIEGSSAVVELDADARRLRRRAGWVLVGQLVALNLGVGALAGDFGWAGVGVAVLALVAGLTFTTWWSRHERGALGPAAKRADRMLPRPAGAAMTIVALAVLGLGVAYSLKGLRYLVLKPNLAQLKWSDFFGITPRAVGVLFAVGGLAVVMLGSVLFRIARALGRSGTKRLLAGDARPPVLYLRSFEDDAVALSGIVSARRPFLELFSLRGADPFEESIAWELDTYGPVVAVGRPGRSLASLGAAREHLPDETWQPQVAERMADAGVIAIALGETEGLRWEIGRIVEAGHLAKTVFVFPPVDDDALLRRWDHTARALAMAGAFVGQLPAAVGRVHTAQLGADGSVSVTVADRRDEATYRTAVDRAMALAGIGS